MKARKIKVRAKRGTITQTGPRSFRAEVMIDGERLRESFGSEEEAQKYLEEAVRRSIKYGLSLDTAKITVAQLIDDFLEAKQVEGRKKTTLQDYRNVLSICKAEWGNLTVMHLSAEHITRLLGRLKAGMTTRNYKGEKVTKPPYSPKSLRNVHGTIHAMLEYALVRDIVDRNVCEKVKPPRVSEKNPEVWTQAELNEFLAVLKGDRAEALFYVLLSTGLRKGEVIGLKWDDVNLETGDVAIRRRVSRLAYGEGVDIDTPKSRAGMRVVTLPRIALEILKEWKLRQALEKKIATVWNEQGWVFTTRTGKHQEPRWINKHMNELIAKARLPHLTVHGLRHTFCTLMLQSGASLKDVAEIAGHSRPSVTLNMYYGSIPGASTRISSKVESLLSANYPEITQNEETKSPQG